MRTFPALLLLALAACGELSSSSTAIVVRDSSGVAIVENDLLRLDASCALGTTPVVSIGEEEGGPEYQFANVTDARRLSDGRIAVADMRSWQLRYYGPDGKHLKTSGRQGEGPGEFRQPYGMHLRPGDTVYVGDIRPYRLLVFGPDGEWVRTIDAKPMMINSPGFSGVLDDGRLMLAMRDFPDMSSGEVFKLQTLSVGLHEADGSLIDTIAVLPNGRSGMLVPASRFTTMPFFESYAHVAARGDRIVLGHGADRELKLLGTGAGTPLTRIIRWTGENRDVKATDVATEKDRLRQVYAKITMPGVLETETSDQRPAAGVFPAMNGIRLGSDGRIWIREYFMPGDTLSRHWLGFTAEGRFDCRLETPRYSQFFEFGRDYLLVLHEDSLGVERVQQIPLTKTGPARR